MRIIFITSKLKNPDTAAGSVIEIDYMMRELLRLGNDVTAVTVFSQHNDLSEKPSYGLIEENINSQRLLGIQWGVFKILKKYEQEADVFHVDGHSMLYGAGLYRWLGGQVPVFAYFNREILPFGENVSYGFRERKSFLMEAAVCLKKRIRWLVERFILMRFAKRIDYASFLNPILCKEYYDFGLSAAKNGLIIGDPYPIEETMRRAGITEYSYTERTNRRGGDKITLFYSGRMAPGKGYDLLLRGFSLVKNKGRFKIVLGGSGPEEPQVRKMIKDLGLESYIELPGWVSRGGLFENLKKSDIYVFTRWRRDMSSVALTEVLVFGLPSIIPAGGGLEWVAGKSGLVFEPENPEDLARQIEKLGTDSGLRIKMSGECYRRLKEPDLDPRQTIAAMNVIMKSLVFRPKQKNDPLANLFDRNR